MSEVILKIENLSAGYGDFRAVHDVSLEVIKGEIVSIIGSNGAGKSSLMKVVGGLVAPKSGKVFYKGADITGWDPHKIVGLGISTVPEGGKVFGRMSVEENLMMGSYPRRARKHAPESLEKVYALFPMLKDKANDLSASLSGGQRQMVAIGRVLMSEPELIILDEVSLGLAPTVIKDIYATVRKINAGGITIILVEQDVKRSLKTSSRAYVMLKGEITLSGASQELDEEEVRKAYFGV